MKYLSLLAFFPLLIPAAKADEWNKRTVVTFSAPVEVPGVQNHGYGVVLGPGTYVMKVADFQSTRDVIQIFNKDESHIFTTTIAIGEYRAEPTDHTVIRFEERKAGSPEAIKDWFYPGDVRGEMFLYPKSRISMNASAAATPVAVAAAAPAPAPAAAPAPAPAPAQAAPQPAPAPQSPPVQIAQANPAPAPAPQPAKKLPKTASDLPLIGLLGLLSMAAGLGLRKSRA